MDDGVEASEAPQGPLDEITARLPRFEQLVCGCRGASTLMYPPDDGIGYGGAEMSAVEPDSRVVDDDMRAEVREEQGVRLAETSPRTSDEDDLVVEPNGQWEQPEPQPPMWVPSGSSSPSETWKEWPHPQDETAFGLSILKPDSVIASR